MCPHDFPGKLSCASVWAGADCPPTSASRTNCAQKERKIRNRIGERMTWIHISCGRTSQAIESFVAETFRPTQLINVLVLTGLATRQLYRKRSLLAVLCRRDAAARGAAILPAGLTLWV